MVHPAAALDPEYKIQLTKLVMAEKDELRVPLSYIDTAQDDKKSNLALFDNYFKLPRTGGIRIHSR